MRHVIAASLLLLASSLAHARFLSHAIVPSSASGGHVVTSLGRHDDETVQLHDGNEAHVKRFFAVVDGDRLVALDDVSSLSGQTVEVMLLRTNRDGSSATETMQVRVEDAPGDALRFANAPYTGHIAENVPVGTEVTGLNDFWQTTVTFPDTCTFHLEGDDAALFSLSRSHHRTALVSAATLDRERSVTLHVVVRAHCSATLEARAHVRVRVDDANDEAPVFTQTHYEVDLFLSRKVPTGPILTVSEVFMK